MTVYLLYIIYICSHFVIFKNTQLHGQGLQRKPLTRYHVYLRLKIVTKTFLEKVQHKSATCWCTTDMLHFRVALLICIYKVKQKNEEFKGF